MYRIFFLLFLVPLFACEEIFEVCDQYERSFSILNMNAGDGEIGFLLAEKYPQAVIVMTEQDIGIKNKLATALVEKCRKRRALKNIVIISAQINVSDAEDLSKCEHFDLVICSKSPKEMQLPKDISEEHVVNLLKEIASHVFIDNHLLPNTQKSLIEKKCLYREDHERLAFKLTKKLNCNYRKCPKTNEYHAVTICPGISLITYLTYRGVWPQIADVKAKLSNNNVKTAHQNATPWNVIISGEVLNFNLPPNEESKANLFAPNLWEIEDDLFKAKSKREMRELIETNYFD